MINQQKIIVMTKLALYDKHEGTADRAASEYFRHDYIYKKNLGTRLAVGVAGFIILGLYWGREILLEGVDILQMDIRQYLTDSVLFLVALLALYSLFGTIKGTREYYLIQKRLDNYNGLIRQLERHEKRGHPTSNKVTETHSKRIDPLDSATKPYNNEVEIRNNVAESHNGASLLHQEVAQSHQDAVKLHQDMTPPYHDRKDSDIRHGTDTHST